MDTAQLPRTIRAMQRIYHGVRIGKSEFRRRSWAGGTAAPRALGTGLVPRARTCGRFSCASSYLSFLRNSVFSSVMLKSDGASNSERAGSLRLRFASR